MSHIDIRKIVESKYPYIGLEWWYAFESMPDLLDDEQVKQARHRYIEGFAAIAKAWNEEKNSEWILRMYWAVKMVLSASVMAQSLEFARKTNLRPVIAYLEYYVLLHTFRALAFTDYHQPWKAGELVNMTHSKTLNVACDGVAKYSKPIAEELKAAALQLQAYRELISYRAPSSGDSHPNLDFDRIKYCRLVLEIAQFQSEIIECSLAKHVSGDFQINAAAIEQASRYERLGPVITDSQDHYRMGYFARKYPRPSNIRQMMTEGHVESFFGSWCADIEHPNHFDPDENCGILFDVP